MTVLLFEKIAASISIYNSCRKEGLLDQLLIALAVFDLLYLLLAFLDSLGKTVINLSLKAYCLRSRPGDPDVVCPLVSEHVEMTG